MDGMGKITLPDGGTYDGMFKEGSYNGKGVYRWKDGATFEGDWVMCVTPNPSPYPYPYQYLTVTVTVTQP